MATGQTAVYTACLWLVLTVTAAAGAAPVSRTPGISGGKVPRPGSFPWMLSVMTTSGQRLCLATLIHPGFAVTTARCFHGDDDPKPWTVREIYQNETRDIPVSRIILYPYFKQTAGGMPLHDLALIQLAGEAYNIPILLPGLKNTTTAVTLTPQEAQWQCWMSGWDATNERHPGGEPSWEMRFMDGDLVDSDKCKEVHGAALLEDNVCFRAVSGTCTGDVGTPMMCYGDQWYLGGFVSWGDLDCSEAGDTRPHYVITRLSSQCVRSWITDQIDEHVKSETPIASERQ